MEEKVRFVLSPEERLLILRYGYPFENRSLPC